VLARIALVLTILFTASTALAAGPDAPSPSVGIIAVSERVGSRWAIVLLAVGLVTIAWLVNRYAKQKRKRIRRTVILFALYLLCFGMSAAFGIAGWDAWSNRLQIAADLFEAFTLVNLIALAVFDLALPKARVELVSITSDILVGITYIIAGIGVFHTAGMNLSSVIATSAIVSGVLALSLQATLGNILGGVALQLDGSIHVGDWIQLENGRQGRVREIHWRHTVVETRDWDTIIVPNASLLAGNITILGKRDGSVVPHREWVYFNVDYRFPPSKVISVVTDALLSTPIERVALDPKPNVVCMDFAKDNRDSMAYYAVRYWLTDLAVDAPTSSAVRTRVYAALRRAGIPMARQSRTVFFAPIDDAQAKRAKHRNDRLDAVQKLDLFSELTVEERDFVADHLVYAPFAPGEIITRQGAVAHWLYVLVSGKAEIMTRVDGGPPKHVAHLDAPTFFGEMGLMTGEPRMADVVARSEVECYRLGKEGFQKILEERPEIATELSKTLARRRVELLAVREGLDSEQKKRREEAEAARILGKIQDFFGLGTDRRTVA
jgi:small-conductance mechanosensitive channel/CRP-like cAMP-binding protein